MKIDNFVSDVKNGSRASDVFWMLFDDILTILSLESTKDI